MEAPQVVRLRSADGATAELHQNGAHLTSWCPASDGDERLFLSSASSFASGKAIRGGVPVIFPQFAAEGPLPRHGFARTMPWSLVSMENLASGDACATLALRDSPETRAIWPASFLLTLFVQVGGTRLLISMRAANAGDAPFAFTAALHSYFRVGNLAETSLEGLGGAWFRVSGAPGELVVDNEAALRPSGEVDRVYVDAPRSLTLREPHRTLQIQSEGFPDVVVWNPGHEKATALTDMEPFGEQHMLCVEAAAVQRPITLAPGAHWEGFQVLTA